jgi:metal-responsive CopG/Arc/MetJ family transcriptional regulator
MPMSVTTRSRRVKLSATVEAELLEQVDSFVAERPGTSRSAVVDEALRLWTARQRERAMEEQYADTSPLSDEDAAEWESWRAIRRASAARLFRDR